MPTIKFSHAYNKLLDRDGKVVEKAVLLDVVQVDLENLSKEFLHYDTEEKFILPECGMYLMLIFQKVCFCFPTSNIFTTLRRNTLDKARYYIKNIGTYFDVQIVEPKDQK